MLRQQFSCLTVNGIKGITMQAYEIKQALEDLIVNSNVDTDSELFKRAAAALNELDQFDLVDKRTSMAVVWFAEDVQSVREDLSDEQAMAVLQTMEQRHDGNIGINWEYIEAVADDLYPEVQS